MEPESRTTIDPSLIDDIIRLRNEGATRSDILGALGGGDDVLGALSLVDLLTFGRDTVPAEREQFDRLYETFCGSSLERAPLQEVSAPGPSVSEKKHGRMYGMKVFRYIVPIGVALALVIIFIPRSGDDSSVLLEDGMAPEASQLMINEGADMRMVDTEVQEEDVTSLDPASAPVDDLLDSIDGIFEDDPVISNDEASGLYTEDYEVLESDYGI